MKYAMCSFFYGIASVITAAAIIFLLNMLKKTIKLIMKICKRKEV